MSKQYCTWNLKKNETRLNNIQKSHAMFDRTNLRGSAGGIYCPCPRLPPTGPYDGPSQRQKHIHNWNITPQTKEQTNLWFIRNDWKTQSMEWQPIFLEPITRNSFKNIYLWIHSAHQWRLKKAGLLHSRSVCQ